MAAAKLADALREQADLAKLRRLLDEENHDPPGLVGAPMYERDGYKRDPDRAGAAGGKLRTSGHRDHPATRNVRPGAIDRRLREHPRRVQSRRLPRYEAHTAGAPRDKQKELRPG